MTPLKIMILILTIFGIIFTAWLLRPEPKLGFGEVLNYIRNAWIYHNGIYTFSYRTGLLSATTTPCAIKSPEATSTIVHLSMDVRLATSSANTLLMGTSTDTGGIDTILGGTLIAANTRGTFVATSTLFNNAIIAPNSYVLGTFSQSYGSTVPSGNCEVIFRVVS